MIEVEKDVSISAVMSESQLVLGSLPCETKISESEIFRELIDVLDISDSIVVADALHCKKKSTEKVIEEKGGICLL